MLSHRRILAVATIVFVAALLRVQALHKLPPDFDELVYLPVAFDYAHMMTEGRFNEIIGYKENSEHPALNKLLFGAEIAIAKPKEPSWNTLDVGRPMSDADKPAFFGPRWISVIGGTIQVLIASIVNPIGALLLALDTYHIKYSAQVYLEGVPGFFAALAVLLLEFGIAKKNQRLIYGSSAALGISTAGKYIYGITGFVLIAFLVTAIRKGALPRRTYVYPLIALAIFLIADPSIWPNPPILLWNSLTYHWQYAHGEHVVSSAMPWYSPIAFLLHSAPTEWHKGVFYTGIADYLILPLSIVGAKRAMRERPIWIAWAIVGIFFLIIWPTKWPQYTLLVRAPLAICAGLGIQLILDKVIVKRS